MVILALSTRGEYFLITILRNVLVIYGVQHVTYQYWSRGIILRYSKFARIKDFHIQ